MSKKKRRPIPNYGYPIIETHCHLDYLKDQPLTDILQRSREIGIERTITIAVAPDNLDRVIDLTDSHTDVWGTQGIHPHDASSYNDEVEARIRENLQYSRILAVGEIGLDYYYEHSERKVQQQVFERQLQLAVEQQLPVVIHSRDADEDTQAILSNFVAQMPHKGVIHSFTSGPALAQYCIANGFCLGFNGICTFKQAENVREVIAATPLTQILLETDSPYLTPAPYRGRENAPFYLPFIAEKIAEVKAATVDEVLQQTYQNSLTTFFAKTEAELVI